MADLDQIDCLRQLHDLCNKSPQMYFHVDAIGFYIESYTSNKDRQLQLVLEDYVSRGFVENVQITTAWNPQDWDNNRKTRTGYRVLDNKLDEIRELIKD